MGSLGMPVGVEGLGKAMSGEMKFEGEDLCEPLERRPGEDAVGDLLQNWIKDRCGVSGWVGIG